MPNSQSNYIRPQCTLESLINEYIISYSCTTIKRTGAYGGSAPVGITKMLQAIAVTSKRNKNEFIKCGEIRGELEKDYKVTMGTHQNLCRLSAQPFPLIETSKKLDENSDEVLYSPLYDEATGHFAAERYSNVRLSRLGEIAFKYSYDIPVSDLKYHKGIVPIALLRKGLSWALGHHSTMYSNNPRELFELQEMMLERNTPYLPSELVLDIYRGPDLGPNYTIYMTNDSLASLYASGTGSMMVVPDIEIDRLAGQIKFLRPPLDIVGTDFRTHLIRKLTGLPYKTKSGIEKKMDTYETISLNPNGDGVFISGSSIIADVIFNTNTDSAIIDELHSDSYIYRNVPLQNILLKTKDGSHIQTDEEDLDATADFEIDVVPIYELLWEHIMQYLEIKRGLYLKRYNSLKNQLKWDMFLEKVTRPEVSDAIMNIWQETHKNRQTGRRREMLMKLFTIEGRDKDLLPEGFDDAEIAEICRTTTANSNTGLLIINIMSDRKKYESKWIATQSELNMLEQIINDPEYTFIRNECKKELSEIKNYKEFQRQSPVYFIEPIDTIDEIDTVMIPQKEWDENPQLPCTLFYSPERIVKSYGRNFNIIPIDEHDDISIYPMSLNVLNSDYVIVYKDGQPSVHSVMSFTSSARTLGTITNLLPYPRKNEKMLLFFSQRYFEPRLQEYRKRTVTHMITNGDTIPVMDKNTELITYCYLDTKYIQASVMVNQEVTALSFKTEDILKNPNKIHDLDIVDVIGTDEYPNVFNLSQGGKTDTVSTKAKPTSWDNPIPTPLNIGLTKVDSPYFVKHLEVYVDNLYMPWLGNTILAMNVHKPRKHMVLSEPHFCHPKDTTSLEFKKLVLQEMSQGAKKHFKLTRSSKAYKEFVPSKLDDWDLFDPRYRMIKPEEPTAIKKFDEFYDALVDCSISEKDFMKLNREVNKLRTVATGSPNRIEKEEDNSSRKVISDHLLNEVFDDEIVKFED